MLRIKSDKGRVEMTMEGSTVEILADLGAAVAGTVESIMDDLYQAFNDIPPEFEADIRTKTNLALIDSIGKGMERAKARAKK